SIGIHATEVSNTVGWRRLRGDVQTAADGSIDACTAAIHPNADEGAAAEARHQIATLLGHLETHQKACAYHAQVDGRPQSNRWDEGIEHVQAAARILESGGDDAAGEALRVLRAWRAGLSSRIDTPGMWRDRSGQRAGFLFTPGPELLNRKPFVPVAVSAGAEAALLTSRDRFATVRQQISLLWDTATATLTPKRFEARAAAAMSAILESAPQNQVGYAILDRADLEDWLVTFAGPHLPEAQLLRSAQILEDASCAMEIGVRMEVHQLMDRLDRGKPFRP
ncbi:MAG: hypothetical protein AAFY60_09325, partial [Myxococcota bacterium]